MKLVGELPLGTTATDLVLTVTQMLRKKGVVDKFVEFYGPGLSARSGWPTGPPSPTWRPEYGATDGLLPGGRRDAALPGADRPRRAPSASGSSATARSRDSSAPTRRPTRCSPPRSSSTSSTVTPSLAGPKRPQDLVPLTQLKRNFIVNLPRPDERQRARRAEGAGAERLLALDGRGRRQRDHRRARRGRGRPRRRGGRPRRAADRERRSSTARTSRCTTGPWSSPPSPAAPTPRTRR